MLEAQRAYVRNKRTSWHWHRTNFCLCQCRRETVLCSLLMATINSWASSSTLSARTCILYVPMP